MRYLATLAASVLLLAVAFGSFVMFSNHTAPQPTSGKMVYIPFVILWADHRVVDAEFLHAPVPSKTFCDQTNMKALANAHFPLGTIPVAGCMGVVDHSGDTHNVPLDSEPLPNTQDSTL